MKSACSCHLGSDLCKLQSNMSNMSTISGLLWKWSMILCFVVVWNECSPRHVMTGDNHQYFKQKTRSLGPFKISPFGFYGNYQSLKFTAKDDQPISKSIYLNEYLISTKEEHGISLLDLADLAKLPIVKKSIEFETNYIFEQNSQGLRNKFTTDN